MSVSFDSDATSRISNSFSFDPSQMGNNFSDLYADDIEESQAEDNIRTPEEYDDPLDFELLSEAIRAETDTAGNQGIGLGTTLNDLHLGDTSDHDSPPASQAPQSASRSTTPTNTEVDDEYPHTFRAISPEPSPSRIRRAFIPECLSSDQENFLHLYHEVEWEKIFGLSRKLNRCICNRRNVEDVRADFLYIFEIYGMKEAQAKWFASWVFGPLPLKGF
jgi:hypothetical protein